MKFNIISMGEALIDFTDIGLSQNGMKIFEQNPGGAPANVACACAKLGLKTAFLGKVGNDMHGDFLIETLKACGVSTDYTLQTDEAFTTLAFVKLSPDGDRSFSFARKGSADTRLCADEIPDALLGAADILHFGSLSLTDEPVKTATLSAVTRARENGCLISYDPNYRPLLWSSEAAAIEAMRSVVPMVDIMKLSDNETELLCDTTDIETAADHLHQQGVKLVLLTCGGDGALISCQGSKVFVPAAQAQVVDTTGAGDSFLGGFLYKLCSENNASCLITPAQAEDFGAFANRVAGFCVGKRGAIPALPTLSDVQ
ncbi:MAG: carbohydrate kinase [Ruminococcaceae bacterium]|nr:carbohydrate kinase [Oscillospiraceae bacterium]